MRPSKRFVLGLLSGGLVFCAFGALGPNALYTDCWESYLVRFLGFMFFMAMACAGFAVVVFDEKEE